MITSGPILMFQVSMEPYWSVQRERIIENGATAFLVAKIGHKWIIHVSELFENLPSWNLESKLVSPKNITDPYLGAIIIIFNFSFSVYFLYVIFFLTPEQAPKGPAAFLLIFILQLLAHNIWNLNPKVPPIFISSLFYVFVRYKSKAHLQYYTHYCNTI